LSFSAKRSHYTAETVRRNWKQPASDVCNAVKLFPVRNAIPGGQTKIELLYQGRLIILLVQEVDWLPEEGASMHRISRVQEVGFLLEEVSILGIDQISAQQFHSQEQIVAVGSVLEDLVVFLPDVLFQHHLDPCRDKVVLKISQRCMAVASVPFLLGDARDSLGESLEGEWLAGGAGFAEVEGASHHFQDLEVWAVLIAIAIT